MRFRQFITEARDFNGTQFIQDCHACLSQLDISKDPEQDPSYKLPFRGMAPTAHTFKGGWDIIKHPKHRKPKDTPLLVHNAMNEAFKKKFGWNVRDGVFVTGSDALAGTFGRTHVVFPIGEFKFVWSEHIEDVYGDLVEPDLGDDWEENWHDGEKERFQKYVLEWNWSDKNFAEALRSRNEIMLSCESYYTFMFESNFFNKTLLPLISEEFGK